MIIRISRYRSDDNIEINVMVIVLEVVDWIHLVQNRDRWRTFMSTVKFFLVRKRRAVSWLAEITVRF
jgi:hypothetical protein